jgi:hypothetical protein
VLFIKWLHGAHWLWCVLLLTAYLGIFVVPFLAYARWKVQDKKIGLLVSVCFVALLILIWRLQ